VRTRLANLAAVVRAFFVGGLVLAPVETSVTLVLAESGIDVAVAARFLITAAALLPLAATALGLALGLVALATPTPVAEWLRAAGGRTRDVERPGRARALACELWASLAAGAALVASLSAASFVVAERFRDPFYQAVAVGCCGLLCAVFALGVRAALRALLERIGAAGWPVVSLPLSSLRAALALVAIVVVAGGAAASWAVAPLREIVPVRLAATVAAVIAASVVALVARRGGGRHARAFGATVVVWGALLALSLVRLGAHPGVKYLVTVGSPALEQAAALVRLATDFDRDGYGVLLGEGDCAPLDARIHPGALEVADNGRDDDCVGGDFSFQRMRKTAGKSRGVPDTFRRPYNVLLLTLDAVRADHTGFHGYARPTTPHLDRLTREAALFERAYAPSAGTVASVPAILAARFFHSQLAVGPERPKKPPLILPENLMVAEIMKAGGLRTGAILGHDYFNDWGLEQGFDHYDNTLGPKREPRSVTSHKLTDKATAFIAAQGDRRWFLWVHYLDAHSEYERHPGFDFGKKPVDLYDGEIRFVDEHVGRLLDFLRRGGQWPHTVVAVTADHGDAFGEHGRTHHGSTLFDEMIRVPLIIRVPDLPGRRFTEVASGLDVVPTLVELAGLRSPAHDFEGKSLVPQLFYDERDPTRAVFAETNWPGPLRALVRGSHKLVYDLKNNTFLLFDLRADPKEKRNLATRDGATLVTLKNEMWSWLGRAVFRRTRDNQAERVRAQDILDRLPPTATPAQATFDDAVTLEGFEVDAAAARSPSTLAVVAYLRAPRGAHMRYRPHARLELSRGDGRAPQIAKDAHAPLGGFYPVPVWKPDELIRERFALKIPARWKGSFLVRLALEDESGRIVEAAGASAAEGWVKLAEGQLR
jgi:arylsulfatase A-like enzyme